jgi:hypothetical protein
MIISARQVDVFAHAEPVDMRKSFDTLLLWSSRSSGIAC